MNELLTSVQDKSIVMIGESTHGTHEFYKVRAEITKELISEYGFSIVAIEGDWPDTFRINRFVKHLSNDTATQALSDFKRFPLWMWRNKVMVDFINWLHEFNKNLSIKTGVFGIDLYGINNAFGNILEILNTMNPEAANLAKQRYSCLGLRDFDSDQYAKDTYQALKDCEDEVIRQLLDIKKFINDQNNVYDDEDCLLNLHLSAQNIAAAEAYYRNLYQPGVSTWNIRDGHMMKCLNILMENERKKLKRPPKVIVWAHNSHVGDASADHRQTQHEITLGEIAKEHFEERVALIGMMTSSGSVTAADNWGDPAKYFYLNQAHPDSHAAYLARLNKGNFIAQTNTEGFQTLRLERAVGVIYRPETEIRSHYFNSSLAKRFDWLIYLEKTSALKPLDNISTWKPNLDKAMDTYPIGL